MIALAVALGAAVGAPTRYVLDRAVQARHESLMPWGTLAVNVVASFTLGLVVSAAAAPNWQALVGTGFCGALSTFSTLSFETVRLAERGKWLLAAANVALSVTAGLAAAAIGWSLG